MKLSAVLTTFIVVIPLFSGQALAAQGNKGNNFKGTKAPPANNNAANNNNNTTSNNNANNNATSNNANNNAGGGDPQTSLTLDNSVLNTGSQNPGTANSTTGQQLSLTSQNNFINFCAGQTITDGLQNKAGSCNPTPMGQITALSQTPIVKYQSPTNGQDLTPNTTFNFELGVSNLITGQFTNATVTYFSAPAQLKGGVALGHSHTTCRSLKNFQDTTIGDIQTFAFFKAMESPAVNGNLVIPVTGGLPPGFYRCCSMTTNANHAAIPVAVAQHDNMDDCIYISSGQGANNVLTGNGGNGGNNNNAGNSTANGNGNNAGNGTANGNGNNAGNSTANGNGNNAGNNTGKNGGNNNSNTGKNAGEGNQGNKGANGRRRLIARLSRDH
ncbi:hypothetical protein EI94DRAFT_1718413 [Lactarius quietus]|nr:hypothetical protein EI94DRAFT_1718413 [Lactarius quietus]